MRNHEIDHRDLLVTSEDMSSMDGFSDIPNVPTDTVMVTAGVLQSGPPMDPLKRLFTYESGEWEQFIQEWASTLKTKYKTVLRASGGGDRGIDIAGFVDDKKLEGVWDNYQCKHYKNSLAPSDIYPEIGKILWHSFSGHYVAPRKCFFVAPRNAGTTASLLLSNATKLREAVIAAWDKTVKKNIASEDVPLMGDFANYVNGFDFGIFEVVPVLQILEQHRATPYYLQRFGGGLPPRPAPGAAPDEIGEHESVYVAALLAAYGDHQQAEIADEASLKPFPKLNAHFKRQREAFYHAEGLRVFVRDKVAPGTFESLQDEVYHGVVDTCDATHPDGFERVVAVTQRAAILPLETHPLSPSTLPRDRHGICHQLANDERLKWTE